MSADSCFRIRRLFVSVLCFQYIAFTNAWYTCPRDVCETCLSAQVHDAPGIGFDLTPSYGTASVHYFNGTVVEVTQIRGNSEYLNLMMRLANDPMPRSDRARNSLHDLLLSWLSDTTPWGAWLRWFNKKLGRPIKANNDVEIIGDLLQRLRIATEREISQPLDRVAVATPGINLLTSLVNAALEDLDLRTWVGDSLWYPRHFAEADAVFAANGFGLCSRYYDLWQCSDEFESSPDTSVYTIFFSRHVLYTSIIETISGEALSRFNWDTAQIWDFDLGLDHLLETNDSQDALWSRLSSQLLTVPRAYPYLLSSILLAGESATHPRFLSTVRDSLAELMPTLPVDLQTNIPSLVNSTIMSQIVDPTFAASRGAALYARRRQEVQGHCTESSECESIRRRERERVPWKVDLR
ncbi:hypothetical protein F1880_005732 [Penicillium rolfsii]|nr:hypothetical protein F1880_005732 [Penicillium rolfsii]